MDPVCVCVVLVIIACWMLLFVWQIDLSVSSKTSGYRRNISLSLSISLCESDYIYMNSLFWIRNTTLYNTSHMSVYDTNPPKSTTKRVRRTSPSKSPSITYWTNISLPINFMINLRTTQTTIYIFPCVLYICIHDLTHKVYDPTERTQSIPYLHTVYNSYLYV